MKVLKFKDFPKSVFYNNEEYRFNVGGEKCIEVRIGQDGKEQERYIFYNVKV